MPFYATGGWFRADCPTLPLRYFGLSRTLSRTKAMNKKLEDALNIMSFYPRRRGCYPLQATMKTTLIVIPIERKSTTYSMENSHSHKCMIKCKNRTPPQDILQTHRNWFRPNHCRRRACHCGKRRGKRCRTGWVNVIWHWCGRANHVTSFRAPMVLALENRTSFKEFPCNSYLESQNSRQGLNNHSQEDFTAGSLSNQGGSCFPKGQLGRILVWFPWAVIPGNGVENHRPGVCGRIFQGIFHMI